NGAVQKRKELRHGLIERSRLTWITIYKIKHICGRDHRVLEANMMPASPLQPWGVPDIFRLPVARRQKEAPNYWHSFLVGDWLAVFGDDTESENPISMLAAARELPAPVDPPTIVRRFGRSCRRDSTSNDDVGPFLIDALIGLQRQRGREKVIPIADSHSKAYGAIDSGKQSNDL